MADTSNPTFGLFHTPGDLGLATDLYQLTMAAAYYQHGMAHHRATFELFVRRHLVGPGAEGEEPALDVGPGGEAEEPAFDVGGAMAAATAISAQVSGSLRNPA